MTQRTNYLLNGAMPAWGAKSSSPFAMKAESLLRLAGVGFERVDVMPTKGPRKKVPFVVTPDGETIADSWNIRRHLEAREGLRLAAAPCETALRRLVEESLYFAQMHFRWAHHRDEVRETFFGAVPWPARRLVFALVHRSVEAATWGQGFGRRPEAEMLEVVADDLDALEEALADRPYFGGDALSALDVSVHGILEQLVPVTLEDPLTEAVRARARLVAVHGRIDEAIYGANPVPAAA
jgi:glutathione S-transferase